jgi:hypothetical protein
LIRHIVASCKEVSTKQADTQWLALERFMAPPIPQQSWDEVITPVLRRFETFVSG